MFQSSSLKQSLLDIKRPSENLSDGLFLIQIRFLLSISLIPKITPYKAWEGKNQVEANHGRVKLPILGMHGTGARFEDIGEDRGKKEARQQFDQVMADVFAFQGDDAEEFSGNKGCVGKDKCQQQKNVHGCGHGGLSVFRRPVCDFNMLNGHSYPSLSVGYSTS